MKYDFIAKYWAIQEVVNIRLDEEMKNEHFQDIVEMLWRYEVPLTEIHLHIWETEQVGNDEDGYSDEFLYDKSYKWEISNSIDMTNLVEKVRETVNFIDKL